MAQEVETLWVVTVSGSLYRATNTRDENLVPMIEKAALTSPVASKVQVGDRLWDGEFVGITNTGLVMFHTQKATRQTAHDVHSDFKGGQTTEIAAIFLHEVEARMCLTDTGLTNWDPEWVDETKAALAAVGRAHSTFIPDEAVLAIFGL